MIREDYQKIKQIFQSALDIPPRERSEYLDRKCPDHDAIRREVEKLLDAFDSDYLEQPAIGEFAETIAGSGLPAGHEIGHYRICKRIGSGGMGDVYLADDPRLERRIAIKILPREFTEDAERIRRFIREAKFVSALNHPNIVTIHEIGETDGQQFIVSEYIEGETLRGHLKRKRLSLLSALQIAVRIASALEAAHGAGIIHRDIKPENIMIRPDGLVKVLDFGVAKLAGSPSEAGASDGDSTSAMTSKQTSPGLLIGTANYMSPEQARGDKIDERTDIFNFGIVLYEMLSGKRAFEGENTLDVMGAILHTEPTPLAQLMPDLPLAIEHIVDRTLRKDRAERFQTAKDLLIELKAAKKALEFEDKLHASDPDIRSTNAEVVSIGNKKQKLGFAVAMAILLFAAIGLGYWSLFVPAANTKRIESIAVMPFVNDGGNTEGEYLADGMTGALINRLSRLPDLDVKARSTVFRYKGKSMDVRTVGKELNVQAVLNGRVAQSGDRLTLTLELIDSVTENILWSAQYERRQTEIVFMVSEIARDVSRKMKVRLSDAEEQKVTRNFTEDSEAFKHYLQGRFYWNKRTAENINKAVEQFTAAIKRDPNYALAYAGLADCYVVMPEYMGTPTRETIPKAEAYANRALEIDETLGEAHAALGLIYTHSWNWEAAEKQFKRAIELSPNYPTAHHWYSLFLRRMGRSDEGLSEIRRATELDPLSLVILVNIAMVHLERGEIDAAAEQARKIIELDPAYDGGHRHLGWAYLKQGRTAEALAEVENAVRISKTYQPSLSLLGSVQVQRGQRNEALKLIKELEKETSIRKRDGDSYVIATIYAGLGEKDKAFAWLEKAFEDHSSLMADLKIELALQPLRDDPRFKDLLRRMNLPSS